MLLNIWLCKILILWPGFKLMKREAQSFGVTGIIVKGFVYSSYTVLLLIEYQINI